MRTELLPTGTITLESWLKQPKTFLLGGSPPQARTLFSRASRQSHDAMATKHNPGQE